MAEFVVHGPFEIPVRREPRATLIDQVALEAKFWENSGCRARRGCYVFGLRAGGGITPFYVGMTVNSFEQECFTPHKLLKYVEALARRKARTPVMFFVAEDGPGRPNAAAIAKLEQQLIDLAVDQNDDLLNIVGTNTEPIIVRGTLGPHHGRASEVTRMFRRMMGLPEEKRVPVPHDDEQDTVLQSQVPSVVTQTSSEG